MAAKSKTKDPRMVGIEAAAAEFGQIHDALADVITGCDREIAEVRRRHAPVILSHVRELVERRKVLARSIDAARDLFDKPRTRTLHGVRLGVMTQRGEISFDDEDLVIDRIRALLPEKAADLVKTNSSVVKTAIRDLDPAMLKRLGVEVRGDVDQTFVKVAKGDAEKAAAALLDGIREDGS